ncbi:MAG: universal stress protein [Acidobacteriota bacterium]
MSAPTSTPSDLKTILAATSLEPDSDAVLRTSAELARRSGAELHLFHAHALPLAYFAAPAGLTTVDDALIESERQVREQILAQQLERLGLDASAIASICIEPGATHRMLLSRADEIDADLLVLGARESDRAPHLGSTTDRVLRKAQCPVWVVDGRPRLPPEQVVAPVDLSPLSESSLRRGLEILRQVGAATSRVEALFVLSETEIESSSQFEPDQIRRLAREELDRLLERLDDGSSGMPLQVEPTVREGEIRDQILDAIHANPFDLVLVGTHGRSGFERFFLGSVAADVAARAGVSVLVIPPEHDDV